MKAVLQQMNPESVLRQIYFKEIQQSDLEEIKKLHTEWFPLSYPQSFYDKILTKANVIAIGCFITLTLNNEPRELILGTIISRIKTGNDDIQEIQKHIDAVKLSQESYLTQFLSMISCKSMFDIPSDNTQGCYIMTLGVLDECRKLGIGTKLLKVTE